MISRELQSNLAESGRRSISTIWWLARIMIPASAAVFVLQRTGVLELIANFMEPAMSFIGLPGAAAMALISSLFINLYAVIAMVPMLGLDQRQLVILALLCLVAHNYLVELAVTRRTGTPVGRMLAVRTAGGLILAWVMSVILPRSGAWIDPIVLPGTANGSEALALVPALQAWLWGTIRLMTRVTVVVTSLVFLTRWLQFVGVTNAIGRAIAYPLSLFGLPASSGTAWIVANTLGLAYGAAVLQEERNQGASTPPTETSSITTSECLTPSLRIPPSSPLSVPRQSGSSYRVSRWRLWSCGNGGWSDSSVYRPSEDILQRRTPAGDVPLIVVALPGAIHTIEDAAEVATRRSPVKAFLRVGSVEVVELHQAHSTSAGRLCSIWPATSSAREVGSPRASSRKSCVARCLRRSCRA
jgi:spore maturation protein SpmB